MKQKQAHKGFLIEDIRLKWFLTYFMILLLPLLLSLLIFIQNITVLKNQSSSSAFSMLDNSVKQISYWTGECNVLAYKVANNNNVSELFRKNSAEKKNYLKLLIKNDLTSYKNTDSLIEEILIYSPEEDMIISSNTTGTSHLFFAGIKESGYKGTYENWKELFGKSYKGSYIYAPFQGYNTFYYIDTINPDGEDGKGYNIIISLSHSVISNKIRTIIGADGDFVITTPANEILYSTNGLFQSGQTQIPVNDRENPSVQRLDSGEYMLFHDSAPMNDWRAVYLIPRHVLFSEIVTLQTSMVLSIFLCILLGILFILIAVRKNYKPIREILDVLPEGEEAGEAGYAGQEYTLIQNTIQNAYTELHSVHSKLDKQQKAIRSNMLARIMKGTVTGGAVAEEFLEKNNIRFISNRFGVVVFFLEDISRLFSEDEITETEQYDLAVLIIDNVITELCERLGCGYVTQVDNMLACLINFSENTSYKEAREGMLKICREAMEFINQHFDMEITIGTGGVNDDLEGISQGYSQALLSLEYRLVKGTGIIIDYKEVSSHNDNVEYYYPMNDEQRFVNFILSGDYEKAVQIADMVIDRNLEQNAFPIQNVKLLIFDMTGTLYKVIKEMDIENDEERDNLQLMVNSIFECQTIEEVRDGLREVIEFLCAALNEQKGSARNVMVERIKSYVRGHYAEEDLGVSSIAANFGITPNYLSRVFKSVSGQGLLNYIHEVRIEKSKELLLHDMKLSTEKIANMVGYNNLSTFNRAFLKYTGNYPKKWLDAESKLHSEKEE